MYSGSEWKETNFLIDSGAEISIIAMKDTVLEGNNCKTVSGIGGNQLIGPKEIFSIRFSCHKDKTYNVWLRPTKLDTDQNLINLGRDFLNQFETTEFDWKDSKIRLGDTWIFYVKSEPQNNWNINSNLAPSEQSSIISLLNEYPDVFVANPRAPRECSEVKHRIRSQHNHPIMSKVRRIPNKWTKDVNEQIHEMLSNNIIEPSCSSYNSNILLVNKKDNTKRFVVDFREVNKASVGDKYPLPSVEELLDQFYGCNYFTQLDLASGYWGIPIEDQDRCKTAFSVPRGKFQFRRMPFGLKNAQATFQRYMDDVVEKCKKRGAHGLDAYVDNLIIYTISFEEHTKILRILLTVLEEHKMSLRKDKCEFAYNSIEFLGFKVDGKNITPCQANLDKIHSFPTPTNKKSLQRFLGIANYNRRFINRYSDICVPLNRLTSSKVPFLWTSVEQTAFDTIKKEFHSGLSLFIPEWSKDFVIKTDASKVPVGSVVGQYDSNGAFRPVGYHSETLSNTVRNWSATERELYAIISASRKWKQYCYEKVTFYSDHAPLRNIHKQKDPRGKIGRWILELENLDYTIKYVKGVENLEADYLSRIEGNDKPISNPSVYSTLQLYPSVIRESQERDNEISSAINQLSDPEDQGIKRGPYRNYANLILRDGLLYKGKRIVNPSSLSDFIIKEYHGQSHLGVENTILAISARFYWRGMKKQIESFVNNCRTCTQCKVSPSPKAPVQDHREIEKLFEMISMDLASMPTSDKGNCWFLLITDNFSKLITAIPLPNAHGETIVSGLWNRWFSYYGLPKFLQSDQGNNVDGAKVRKLCEEVVIKKIRSATYHPAGNGSAERAIGFFKTILRSMCLSRNIAINRWDEILPEAILHYNNTQNSSTKFSPFQVAYGMSANLVIDNKLGVHSSSAIDKQLVRDNINANRCDARANYQKQANKSTRVNPYNTNDMVLLKRTHGSHPKMNPYWVGPFKIIKQVGPVNWAILDQATGKSKIVHHDLLKPALTKQDATIIPELTYQPQSMSSSRIHISSANNNTSRNNISQIDRAQFTNNVFNTPNSLLETSTSLPENHSVEPRTTTTTRSGRVSIPVIGNRLIDEMG